VPFTLPGELVECIPVRDKARWCEASLVKVIKPSGLRTSPICRYFGMCGGCHYQHMAYKDQLITKEDIFRSILVHQVGVSGSSISPIIASKSQIGWRARARLGLCGEDGHDNAFFGFFFAGSHELVRISTCPMLRPCLNHLLKVLHGLAGPISRTFWDMKGLILESGIDDNARGVIISKSVSHNARVDLLEGACTDRGICLVATNGKTMELSFHPFKRLIFYNGPRVKEGLFSWPGSFFQANVETNVDLVEKVVESCQQAGSRDILELYSGCGNFSIPLALMGFRVTAVEVDTLAFEAAKINRARNMLDPSRLRLVNADATKYLAGLGPKMDFDTVVLDPPRQGAKRLCQLLAKSDVRALIYVSCDPMTLARDVKILGEGGFELVESSPIDMFPHTFHIESVTKLTRKQ